uniref:RUN domain-containing protein n=1 Tax=Macrostomum lignano TaxID=282301 RepID=A0A1I8FER5_9PLAT
RLRTRAQRPEYWRFLKDSAKNLVSNVTSLLKTVKTVEETSPAEATRALEASIRFCQSEELKICPTPSKQSARDGRRRTPREKSLLATCVSGVNLACAMYSSQINSSSASVQPSSDQPSWLGIAEYPGQGEDSAENAQEEVDKAVSQVEDVVPAAQRPQLNPGAGDKSASRKSAPPPVAAKTVGLR